MFLEEYKEGMQNVDKQNKQNDENYKNQYQIYQKKLEKINKDALIYRKKLEDERKTTNCDSWHSISAYCNNGKHGEFTETASTESCCFLGFFGYCASGADDGKKQICKRPQNTITTAVNNYKIEKQQTLKEPKKTDIIPYGQFNPNINCCTNIIQNIADGSKLDQIQQKCDQVIQNIINQEQRKEGDSTVKADVVLKIDQENDSKHEEGDTEVNKTSNTIVILIVVFVVLLLVGVIGGGLFYYYKNNNSDEGSNTEGLITEDSFNDE
jgi:membrane-associated HD superfamily phosphohydrolase